MASSVELPFGFSKGSLQLPNTWYLEPPRLNSLVRIVHGLIDIDAMTLLSPLRALPLRIRQILFRMSQT